MTRDEGDRIDALSNRIDNLIEQVAETKVDTKNAITESIKEHEQSCHEDCLVPMKTDVKWLVENAKKRSTEAALREEQAKKRNRRLLTLVGVLVPVFGILAPLMVHWGVI
jgi:hypothetical protein